jgi:serine protease AprX
VAAVEFNGVTYQVMKFVLNGEEVVLYADQESVYTPDELRRHVAAQTPRVLSAEVADATAQARATDELALVVWLRLQPAEAIGRAACAAAAPELEAVTRQIQSLSRRALPTGSLPPAAERDFVPRPLDAGQQVAQRALLERRDALEQEVRAAIATQIAAAVAPSQNELAAFVLQRGGMVTARISVMNVLGVRLPVAAVEALAAHPLVAQIDLDHAGQPELDIQRQSLGLDTGFWAVGIDGGIHDVGVLDTGVQQSHPALNTHTFMSNSGTTDPDGHGTGIAGIMASTDATYRGMAWGCDKIVWSVAGGDTTSMNGMAYIAGTGEPENCNYSFGNGTANDTDYSSFDKFFDGVINTFGYMVSKSTGNGGYSSSSPTITHPAPAYNLMASANMDDFNTVTRNDDRITSSSSVGPTLGGRKKPDITAPGTNTMTTNRTGGFSNLGGTSSASPHTGGGIVLLYDMGVPNVVAAKAVLLNTTDAISDNGTSTTADDFWVAGSLWNRRYGWGYINHGTAYLHGLDVFTDAIPDEPENADFRLYVGQMFTNERATLVWQRHVAYSGANYPTQVEDLSDLDLTAYRESDGQTLASSTSRIDNVEQLDVDEDALVVLKVEAFAQFDPNVPTESFALATQENFYAASGPVFAVAFTHQPCVVPGGQFPIQVAVTNTGDLTAHNVQVTLSGVTVIGGSNPASLGSIAPESSAVAIWTAEAPLTQGTYPLAAAVASASYGETFTGAGNSTFQVAYCALGDMNCDGIVSFDDINPFVLALSDPLAYAATYPNCNLLNGDCNFDESVDFDDINCFVALFGAP